MPRAEQLRALAGRKALIRARIAARRRDCCRAASSLAVPLRMLDRGVALWRIVSPVAKWAAVPAGIAVIGRLGGPGRSAGRLLRFAPLVLGAARSLLSRTAGP